MSLLDTIDGSFMNFAYGWAFSNPARKAFYNLAITGLSVAVALAIGTVELGGLLAQKLGARGSFWSWLEHIDIGSLGVIIVAMFLGTWVLALSIWRFGRIEERFALASPAPGPATATAAAAAAGDQASGV
jgi:high-affinity nickel-transport protein